VKAGGKNAGKEGYHKAGKNNRRGKGLWKFHGVLSFSTLMPAGNGINKRGHFDERYCKNLKEGHGAARAVIPDSK
jgi:hypothetical protein